MKLLERVSPIIGHKTETADLSFYAPSPWKIVKCLESNLVYLQNPPEYEHLEEDLAWEKTRALEKKKRVKEEPFRSAISNRFKKLKGITKRNKIRDMIKSYIAKNDLKDDIMMVDVGCAEGQTLINTIAELPESVQDRCIPNGIEISKSLAEYARKNAPKGHWVCNNAVDGMLEFRDESIDIFVLRSFLEHEVNPVGLLKNAYNKLKSGGVIFIKVPNFNSFNRLYRKEKWCGFRHPDHVNYFTPETLVKTCLKAGYSNIKMGIFDKQVFSDSMYATLTK
tara:strand:- start:2470 stop:3309 length:840 start_codon:yes stop_codon:yes gene_type:complete